MTDEAVVRVVVLEDAIERAIVLLWRGRIDDPDAALDLLRAALAESAIKV